MLVELRVHDRLVELVVITRVTVPAKPFNGETVIADVPAEPAFAVTVVGLAVPVKSWTWNTTLAVRLSEPLVPVTVARLLPAVEPVHDRVEVPDPPEIVVWDRVHERLVELAATARLTVPVKPSTGATVIVDVPATPTFMVALVGTAIIVNPLTSYVTVTVWDRLPLVPVTPTWKIPVEENLHDRVALPDPATLVGDTVHDVLLVERPTLPAKPVTGVTFTVVVPLELALTVTLFGLAVIVKSWTLKVTVTEWDRLPLAPVTETCFTPVELNVHDRVALPEPVMLAGETLQKEVVLVARLTVPVKPPRLVTVTVDVPAAFTFALTLDGLADTEKSVKNSDIGFALASLLLKLGRFQLFSTAFNAL
jgi:hypothetical protein